MRLQLFIAILLVVGLAAAELPPPPVPAPSSGDDEQPGEDTPDDPDDPFQDTPDDPDDPFAHETDDDTSEDSNDDTDEDSAEQDDAGNDTNTTLPPPPTQAPNNQIDDTPQQRNRVGQATEQPQFESPTHEDGGIDWLTVALVAVLIILAIAGGILAFRKYHHHNSLDPIKLETAQRYARKLQDMNVDPTTIKDQLKKGGWPDAYVDKALEP